MADNPNMRIYDAVRSVPPEAIKPITAGRLKGKSDINPMWRIKVLTEQFGPCGEGWYTEGVRYWTVIQEKSLEMAVFCELQLHTKGENGWSAPIYGIGGNTVIAAEKNGLYLDDEAYKKAYTDALSVACKALGIGADVYWNEDRTKYGDKTGPDASKPEPVAKIDRRQSFNTLCQTYGVQDGDILNTINTAVRDGCLEGINGDIGTMTDKDFARCMAECERRFRAALS